MTNLWLFESPGQGHDTFHKTAGEIIRLINSGDKQKAVTMLGSSCKYIAVSEKTVSLIRELKAKAETKVKAGS